MSEPQKQSEITPELSTNPRLPDTGSDKVSLGDVPERYLVFFEDWCHVPLAMNFNLSADQTVAMVEGGIHDLLRLAYKAGYEKAQFLYGLEETEGCEECGSLLAYSHNKGCSHGN